MNENDGEKEIDLAKQPRIPLVTREAASDEQRRVGDFIYEKRNEEYAGPSAILLHVPQLAEQFELMREHIRAAGLPQDLMQLATLVIARHWSVDYVWHVRVGLAEKAGIGADIIESIRIRQRPKFTSAAQEAIYVYTSELLGPIGVTDAAHQAVRKVLGSDVLMIELTALVGLYTMLALQGRAADIAAQAGSVPLPK